MQSKQILVIDQDEVILSILKKSLQGFEPNAVITTVNDYQIALGYLTRDKYDAIIVDSALVSMDGEKIYCTIRDKQVPAPVLIVTGYPNSELTFQESGLQIAQTLFKPLEIGNLNNLLTKVFNTPDANRQNNLSLTEQIYDSSQKMMDELLRETNARCIVLSDLDGRILLQTGATQDMAIDEVVALLGGGIATLLEAGKNLSDNAVINLTYREGTISDLYAINIGERFILVLVIDRGPFYNRLGTVWFYARQTAIKLMENMAKAAAVLPEQLFDEHANEAYSQEIDKLFKDLTI